MLRSRARQAARLSSGFIIQLRILRALILRELHTRYGRENIGFLWIIAEPMMFASVVTLLHLGQSTHYSSDMQPAPFMIIGYVIFIIFRNTFNRADGAIEGNQSLFYHRQVTVFDVIVARIVMEVLGISAAIIILLSFAIATGYARLPERPFFLLTAALLMAWWSLAVTMIAASFAYRNELIGRQLHIISYFTIPVSGAFIQLSWLPPGFRDWMKWFPMPLIFEQARYGQFRSAPATFVSPGYVSLFCATLTLIGMLMINRTRNKVHG